MLSKNQLCELTPGELLLLQKHIRLGKPHLEKVLNQDKIEKIFQLASVAPEVRDEIRTDKAEVTGATSLVVNSVLTAILGAWMSMSGFWDFRMNSPTLVLSVLSFALLLGAFIGFQYARTTKKNARKTLEKRKLQDIELSLLSEVNKKRNQELHEKISELAEILDTLGIRHHEVNVLEEQFDTQEACLEWLTQTRCIIRKENPYAEDLLAEVDHVRESCLAAVKHERAMDKRTEELNQIIDNLANTSAPSQILLGSWIRTNFKDLFFGLIPTMFGSFSSLFVYFGGAPTIAKEMGKHDLFYLLTLPETKLIEFTTALCITAYFAFSYLHQNHKAFKRDQELAKEQALITKEKEKMVVLDEKILKIKEALNMMQRLLPLFYLAKKKESKVG